MIGVIARIKRSRYTKVIRPFNIILLFLLTIFVILKSTRKSSPNSIDDSRILYIDNSSFRKQLCDERLRSHSKMYDNSVIGCNNIRPANSEQEQHLSTISSSLPNFRQQMVPYPNDYFQGRGIVFTVGSGQLKFTQVNLKMIEHSGTRLPVQIWYSSTQIQQDNLVKLFDEAPKVNLSICCFDTNECKNRQNIWKLNSDHVYKPRTGNVGRGFPYKPAAIISATFAEVIFLDSDAYVARDPEEIFLHDRMYHQFGALFYPDAHRSRQPSNLWKVLNTNCGEDEYELDSATIIVNKKKVWNGLYMTKLMNDNKEMFYQRVTDGDKDTFRFGFRYMNVKYYLVMIPCASGSYDSNRFCGQTLCKMDSLAQYIYINHVHIFKYEGIPYTRDTLGYTRVGLIDPNNNSFLFTHCRLPGAGRSCFQIMKRPNPRIIDGQCYTGEIPSDEIEEHSYTSNEPLLYEETRKNHAIFTKTNNVIPNFVENLLKYIN